MAAFKVTLDDASSRAAAWLAESKKADEARRRLDAKDDGARAEAAKAEADAAAGRTPAKLRKVAATAEERSALRRSEEKVTAEFEALMDLARALSGEGSDGEAAAAGEGAAPPAGELSVSLLVVTPLKELLAAMTAHATSRALAGLFVPPAGGITPRGYADVAEARGEDEVEADAAEAEAMLELEERRIVVFQTQKSMRDVRFIEAGRMREASRKVLRAEGSAGHVDAGTFTVDDVPDLLDDIELELDEPEGQAEAPGGAEAAGGSAGAAALQGQAAIVA